MCIVYLIAQVTMNVLWTTSADNDCIILYLLFNLRQGGQSRAFPRSATAFWTYERHFVLFTNILRTYHLRTYRPFFVLCLLPFLGEIKFLF